MKYVQKTILKQIYKPRDDWCHKGQFGRLFCIVGNEWNTGSPIFVGMAACRAGCDLVFLTGPARAMDAAMNYSPMLITKPLSGSQLEKRHVNEILNFIHITRPKGILIGNGLWREQKTKEAIVELIKRIETPMVIDADAIRALAKNKNILNGKHVILTPHANEFKELTGIELSTNIKDRAEHVKNIASELGQTILLKGHIDIISNGKDIVLNKTGSVCMTKGGCGDTLAGICAALVARGVDLFIAAQAAAYINGNAGDRAAKKHGEGMLPTDLIEEIPYVIKS